MDLAAWVTWSTRAAAASQRAAQAGGRRGELRPAAAPQNLGMVRKSMAAEAPAPAGFSESTRPNTTSTPWAAVPICRTIPPRQLELFPAVNAVACRKQLVFTAAPVPWNHWSAPILDQGYAATSEGTVGAYLEFDNKEANRSGACCRPVACA